MNEADPFFLLRNNCFLEEFFFSQKTKKSLGQNQSDFCVQCGHKTVDRYIIFWMGRHESFLFFQKRFFLFISQSQKFLC